MMEIIIRNKLKIIPNAYSQEEYDKQINKVADFCSAMEDGIRKVISFTKITPKPTDFIPASKEEDDWFLKNWGTRNKALNTSWISDEEMIFDTICNPPLPIILKIISTHPEIDFEYKFSGKRIGTKAGEINASGGKIISFKHFENFSKEAYDTAFELMPYMKNIYTFCQKTNTYEFDASDFIASIEQKGFYREDDGTVLIGCDDKRKPLFNSIDDLPF